MSHDEDSDDDKYKKWKKENERKLANNEDIRKWKHDTRRKMYHDNDPSSADLKQLVDRLHSKITEFNNSPNFRNDVKQDTTAVGLSRDSNGNPKLVITANTKERRDTNSTHKNEYVKLKTPDGSNQKAAYVDYGINEHLAEVIMSEVRQSKVYKKSRLDVDIVEEKHNPKDNPQLPTMLDKAKDHASKHAESKMQAAEGDNLSKVVISKKPCKGCHEDLSTHGVDMHPDTPGTKNVTNRRTVDPDEVTVRKKIDRSKEVEADIHFYNNNIHLSTKAFKETVKTNIKGSLKPGASVGVISGLVQLTESIEGGKVKPYADGGALNATAGSVENTLGGKTYHARTSVLEGRTGFGDLASIGASALSAGAHAEYGWNNSVGVNASVVRVDGNLGPVQAGVGLNFDTHASIGANGVSASFLGMGFSFGPKIAIQTPFFDFGISLF